MKILPSAIQALLCFSVLGSSAVWGNKGVNDEVVTTRSSERGDSAFIHRNLRLGDGSDVHTIINGEPLDITQYPYLVHLVSSNTTRHSMGCGGSLVAKDVVLTAAHCITDIVSTKSTLVTIKRFDLTNTDVGEVIKVKNWIVHPDWNSDKKEFDYALLVLECATTQDIKLVQLNSDENFPLPGALARTMGWGKTEVSDGSDVALKVDTEVISNVECREKLAVSNAKIEDFHICTFKQSKGVCGGDSGGPLIIPGASPEQDVQIGIVQFGQASCIQQIPDVFARVSNQLGWIKKNVCCASCSETTFVCSSETTFDCSSETTFDCKSSKAAKHAKKM